MHHDFRLAYTYTPDTHPHRANIDLPRSFMAVTARVYVHVPFHLSVLPRFRRVAPIKRTLARSHGVALMPAERMRNAYACQGTAHIYVASFHGVALAIARVRTLQGVGPYTSSGGFPSHVSRGENAPPASRQGR